MANQKSHIAYHNIRMNLNNEQHRRVHKVLMDLNTDVHKSVNQFMIDAADAYIRRLKGEELVGETGQDQEKSRVITDEDLINLRKELKEELLKELVIILGSAFAVGRGLQMPEIREEKNADDIKREEVMVDETTIGLASSWG